MNNNKSDLEHTSKIEDHFTGFFADMAKRVGNKNWNWGYQSISFDTENADNAISAQPDCPFI